jgi:hypothetical protein
VAFDQAAALEALKWATGGEQLDIPGIGARRFVGVERLPDDGQPRSAGRPPGAQNLVPAAFREYLAAKYGSPVEGLAQFHARPVVSIVAELVEAFTTIATALGISPTLTRDQVLELVRMVPALQLQARRYAAPYMHTQAPQPLAAPPAQVRIGVAMFTGGRPDPAELQAAGTTLAGLLGIEQNQQVIDGDARELDAEELDADG